MTAGEKTLPATQGARVFGTTRWTVVIQAGGPTSAGSASALEQLCRTYWYPIYYFARRSGVATHDAEDLTQSFFMFLLEKDTIARADRERGRFRSFLLVAFKNFHANDRARQTAAKRGGGRLMIPFDELSAEDRYQEEPLSPLSPERSYEQKWAMSLLDQAMQALRLEYATLGKSALFDVLRKVIWGGRQEESYESLSRLAGINPGAFKVAVHRARARFKECLRLEVAQTVATPGEVDDELRHLLSALGG